VGQHQLLLNPKRAGTTQIVLWDPQQRTSFYDVNVTPGAPVVVRNGAPKTDGDSLRIRFQVGQSRLIDTDFNAARVVVTDSDLADVQVITPRQILINGKNPGVTSLIIWTTEGKSVFYDLEVSVNTDLLRERLANALPDARVEIEAARAGVILSGEVADLDQLNKALTLARAYSDQVTNLLRVGGSQQVQLEVRIAEVSRTALRKAGINLFTQSGKWTLGVFGPGTAIGDAAVIPPSLSSQPTFFDTFQLAVGATKDMASIISLLESQGLSKTLASPTLVALSGQEASFLVGGEFPIPVSQKDGAITIEFKEFGV
jgi:pilus assembly protein CpaC